MEQLKKRKTVLRISFTKALNSLDALLENAVAENTEKSAAYELLVSKHNASEENAAAIIEKMVADDEADADIEKEMDEHDIYNNKFFLIKQKFTSRMAPRTSRAASVDPMNVPNVSGPPVEARKSYHLPQIELKKFSGDIREWLQFWSLFKNIDEDKQIGNEEKFQYLIQAMVPDSRASELVKSYPPTSENYPKVIESLKQRLVESSLPEDFLRIWQRFNIANKTVIPSGSTTDEYKSRLDRLISFMGEEVEGEYKVGMAVEFASKEDNEPERAKKTKAAGKDVPSARNLLASKGKTSSCIFCDKSDHDSGKCAKGKQMTISERQEMAKKKRACFNCLKIGHGARFCRVNVKCTKCSRRHMDIMCYADEPRVETQNDKPETAVTSVNIQEEHNLASSNRIPTTFMPTLKVKVRSDKTEMIVRAVIDTGSQNSYILRHVANKLEYQPITQQDMIHLLFGGDKSSVTTHNRYLIHVGSLDGSYWCNFEVLDERVICADVPSVTEGSWLKELKNMNVSLSDVCSAEKTVSLLIGADIAGKLYTGRVHLLKSGLTAIETHLGWTLMGKVPTERSVINRHINLATSAISMYVQNAAIKDLWTLDAIGISDPIEQRLKEDEYKAINQAFLNGVIINEEGRYEVKLPWCENHPALSDNKSLSISRLQNTTRKLKANELYDVIKEDSTTVMRPVFDASAKERGAPSINDCVEKGANLIELVTSCLLNFREGKIGVVSDIRKAFLQISVDVKDRDFLRFLWYDEQGNMIIFRHCRIVFGLSCSPFILAAVLGMHLERALKSLDDESRVNSARDNIVKLMRSFYVDNCVTSVNSLDQLESFKSNAKAVMESASFDLRGWEYTRDNSSNHLTNVLGIAWDKKDDTLALKVNFTEKLRVDKITKRSILSATHRIFDPLGFAAPVTILPRLLLQETWAQKLAWDTEVSDEIKSKFLKWANNLSRLSEIKVPRCLFGELGENDNVSIHTFVDASKDAYAAVVFLRVENESGIRVNFIQAKSRITPIKQESTDARASITRLELLAATIGARLTASILESFKGREFKVFYWSDSSTVLTWIRKESNWATFVWNRVKEIRSLSSHEQWRHVPGELNPADLPSRGCTTDQLLKSRWWEGPEWLKLKSKFWPADVACYDEEEVNKELKKSAQKQSTCALLVSGSDSSFERFESYEKVKRIVAWIFKFFNNAKIPVKNQETKDLLLRSNVAIKTREGGKLLDIEIENAEISLLKGIQQDFKGGKDDARIRHLLPFENDDGLLRLKSKIVLREDSFNFRCPIILPNNNSLVALIVKQVHIELQHAGVEIVLSKLRERFWILKGRKLIRSLVNKCVDCRRYDAKPLEAEPAPLPLNRVRDAAVFEVVGVDYTGPLFLKGG